MENNDIIAENDTTVSADSEKLSENNTILNSTGEEEFNQNNSINQGSQINSGYALNNENLKINLKNDLAKIDMFVNSGIFDYNMGQNLKQHILQKAFDNIFMAEKNKNSQVEMTNVIDEFNKNSGNFFGCDGRKDVLSYLKNEVKNLSTKDLQKISAIIKSVEESAVNRYISKSAHDKSLQESNEQAKQKLTANAQYRTNGINLAPTFTREQIGKMSCAEFAKHEKEIMKQLREGKIR